MYYMTWGRKNGDKVFYRIYSGYTDSTYEYMDSLLRARYLHVADTNQAEVSPVGAVWRHLRSNHPSLELYAPDESHPSLAGSYAAACSFYTTIFRKDPMGLNFDASLNPSDALTIRQAVRAVVYDSLATWSIGKFDSLRNPSCSRIGLYEPETSIEWAVYPNPANTNITIYIDDQTKSKIIRIHNAHGQFIENHEVINKTHIDISKWPNGLYFFQSEDEETFKLLKY